MSTQTTSELYNKLQLSSLGIDSVNQLYYQLSYDELYAHETADSNNGLEKGNETSFGAISVDTGKFTGRSAKDKYIVQDDETQDSVWWENEGSTNKPLSPEAWTEIKPVCVNQLSNKKLYIMDGYCGANKDTRIAVRLVTEVAWQAHFFKNMFIRPTDEELESFEPDFKILNACKATFPKFADYGMRSEVFVAFN